MSVLPVKAIKSLSDLHPKPADIRFQYGTAGFRTMYVQTAVDEYNLNRRTSEQMS